MDQPMPTAGGQPVTPAARVLFLELLDAREQKGIATYGTSLHTDNGRDAIQDALEELIDGWQYLVQIKLEYAERMQRLHERIRQLEALEWATVDCIGRSTCIHCLSTKEAGHRRHCVWKALAAAPGGQGGEG